MAEMARVVTLGTGELKTEVVVEVVVDTSDPSIPMGQIHIGCSLYCSDVTLPQLRKVDAVCRMMAEEHQLELKGPLCIWNDLDGDYLRLYIPIKTANNFENRQEWEEVSF